MAEEHEGRIVVVLRTHSQQDHIARILKGYDYAPIRGISHYCRNSYVRSSAFPYQLCRFLAGQGLCRCDYIAQFERASKARVVSLLYSHLPNVFHQIVRRDDVVVLDEYHHVIEPEIIDVTELWNKAEEELGGKLVEPNPVGLEERGLKIWASSGQSYSLELSKLIRSGYHELNGRKYAVIDYLSQIPEENKLILISATPLPREVVSYDEAFEFEPKLEEVRLLVYKRFTFTHRTRKDPRTVDMIRALLQALSGFRTIAFLPSYESREIVRPQDLGYSEDPRELPTALVMGGKYAEGIDINDSEVVLVIGIPYPDPFEEATQIAQRWAKKKGIKGWQRKTAFIRAFQALGRGIRSPNARQVLILADRRYADLRTFDLAPGWFRAIKAHGIESLKVLREYLTRYWLFGASYADEWLERREAWWRSVLLRRWSDRWG